ncbi:hypothetical protein [Streptomyces fradiae]|uniref:hypothetical protein n=1 Tax=Streptomyces fradiae TaxID=1906 RepID=UPI00380B76B1
MLLSAGGHVHAFEGDLVGGMPWLVDRLAEKGAEGGAELLSGSEQPAQRVGRAVGPLAEDVAAESVLVAASAGRDVEAEPVVAFLCGKVAPICVARTGTPR